jgi:hypothetical protein
MVDTACGGQKMLKDVLPGNLVTREYEVTKKKRVDLRGIYLVVIVNSTIGFGRTWSALEDLWSD